MSSERGHLVAAQRKLRTWATNTWRLPLEPGLAQEATSAARKYVTWQCDGASRKSMEELLAKATHMANKVKASAGGMGVDGAATPLADPQPAQQARAWPPAPKRTWANVAASRKSWASVVVGKPHVLGAKAPVAVAPKGAEKSKPPLKSAPIVDVVQSLAIRTLDDQGAASLSAYPTETAPSVQFSMDHGLSNISSKARYMCLGMHNSSNSCYVNVVVQALLPCSALMQLLSNCDPRDSARPFYSTMASVFKPFFVSKGKTTALSRRDIDALQNKKVVAVIQRWRELGSQQDAGEFLFHMLEGMHEECKWKTDNRLHGLEDSPIMRIFGGLARIRVTSNHDSFIVDPFNHLMLDISADTIDSVRTALEAYCAAEALDDGRATKTIQFDMLPDVLILSVKRFCFSKEAQCPTKIHKYIKYEEHLQFKQEWLVDGIENKQYQLASVIFHHGQFANGGHYTAASKYTTDWYMFDDRIVRKTNITEVLDYQSSAYLLMYVSAGRCSMAV